MADKNDVSLYDAIDHRFANESVTAVMRFINTIKFPIDVAGVGGMYVPNPGTKPELYQYAGVYADQGNGRVSKGLRALELLSRVCRGVPPQNLFLFSGVEYLSDADSVNNATDTDLIRIVIANLGLTNIVAEAQKNAPTLVDNFNKLCYRIGYHVRSGTFEQSLVKSQVLVYSRKLSVAASKSDVKVKGVTKTPID